MEKQGKWTSYLLGKREAKGQFGLKDSLGRMLAKEDDEGNSAGELLIAAYVEDRMGHPERISLKELSSALGESKQSVDVTSGGEPLDFFAPPKGEGG